MLCFKARSNCTASLRSKTRQLYCFPNTFVLFIKSAGMLNKDKFFFASLHTSTWLLVFPVDPIVMADQRPTRDYLYEPFSASDNMNSLIGMIFNSTSRAPVGVLGNAEEIMRQASLCTLASFFTRYFLFSPPTQDVHAYVITGRIIAVYIHRMLVGFNPHALPTICLHCNVICVMWGFQVSLLSRVTPSSVASVEISSWRPFKRKVPKSGFLLLVNRTISVFLLLN